tara:strand:+ start:257 stop:895 length:639 start_codon:yes stop_codon:yes gene_type:complete
MKRNLVFVLAVLFLAGCAKFEASESGFLNDYSNLRESTEVEGLLVEKYEHKHLGQYSKFIVEPIQIQFIPDAKGEKIDDETREELAEKLHDKVVAALEENYEVVDEPGPGVLRIEAALSDLVANKVYLNLHWSTTLSKQGIGGAAIEADFTDSLTNERVMAIVDSRQSKLTGGNPVKSYTRGLSKWGHTENVFDEWVKLFIAKLDELHGISE